MRVYLDNCCYNRPFDDWHQMRIKLEAIAKLAVQYMMYERKIDFAWSKVLDYEISRNPDPKRRSAILYWRSRAAEYIDAIDFVKTRGLELEAIGLKPKDALHLASAEAASCDICLTTDDGILKKASQFGKMKIMNPVNFIMEAR